MVRCKFPKRKDELFALKVASRLVLSKRKHRVGGSACSPQGMCHPRAPPPVTAPGGTTPPHATASPDPGPPSQQVNVSHMTQVCAWGWGWNPSVQGRWRGESQGEAPLTLPLKRLGVKFT